MYVRLKLIAMGVVFVVSIFMAFAVNHLWQWLVVLALAFSWLGDALLAHWYPLTRRIPDPFVPGMGAFAVAQIIFTIAFWQSMRHMPQLRTPLPGYYTGIEVVGALWPIYVMAGIFFWALFVLRSTRQTKDIKIAALVYAILLTNMAAFAAAAAHTGTGTIWQLIAGGLLFVISDGIIAAHIFAGRIENEKVYDFAVWATYFPAQVLLMLGAAQLY